MNSAVRAPSQRCITQLIPPRVPGVQEFYSKLREQGVALPVDLSVQVLTTGSWPTQITPKCQLPRELEMACEEFKNYYLSTHSGRRLTWQTSMGTADIRATFANDKKHEINVSTHQMCILLLFNEADRLTYQEIAEVRPGTAAGREDFVESLLLRLLYNFFSSQMATLENFAAP